MSEFEQSLFYFIEEFNRSGDLNYVEMVLSGDPEQVYGLCGFASVELAQALTKSLEGNYASCTSEHEDANGHCYLIDEDTEEVIDPTAGQFIPESSRSGFEDYFTGNMFVGPREVLREITSRGVINSKTAYDPSLTFARTWGDIGKEWGG